MVPSSIARGSELLGAPIQVISGTQRAHFMFRGVVGAVTPCACKRHLMDLGGRSTELALGKAGGSALLPPGQCAVECTFFRWGIYVQRLCPGLRGPARQVLQPAAQQCEDAGGWDRVYASTSMASAVTGLCRPMASPTARAKTCCGCKSKYCAVAMYTICSTRFARRPGAVVR